MHRNNIMVIHGIKEINESIVFLQHMERYSTKDLNFDKEKIDHLNYLIFKVINCVNQLKQIFVSLQTSNVKINIRKFDN